MNVSLHVWKNFVSVEVTDNGASQKYHARDERSVIKMMPVDVAMEVFDKLAPMLQAIHEHIDPHCTCNDCLR